MGVQTLGLSRRQGRASGGQTRLKLDEQDTGWIRERQLPPDNCHWQEMGGQPGSHFDTAMVGFVGAEGKRKWRDAGETGAAVRGRGSGTREQVEGESAMALFGTPSKLSAVRALAKDALKGALGGSLGEALDTAKTQVKSRLEARGLIRPSATESGDATGTPEARLGGSIGLSPVLLKEWQAVGRSLTLQWQLRWTALDKRWRENEARARQSSGGEVLAGEWLAVGEQLLEAWASMGRTLVSGWETLPRFGTWIEMESSLDGALQQAWRSFRPIWGEARSRIYTAMSPKTLTPQAEALRTRLDEALRRGESTLSDAWLSSQGFLQSSVRDCIERHGIEGRGSAETVSAGLEAAWAFLLGNLERAWAVVMDSLEAALQA